MMRRRFVRGWRLLVGAAFAGVAILTVTAVAQRGRFGRHRAALVRDDVEQIGATVGWRLDGRGHYPSANPPLVLSPRTLVWRIRLPAWSNASPIVVGDRVFVCAEPTTLICVAEADGRILWKRDAEIVDDLLTPEERTRFESVQRRWEAIERERIGLLVAMSRETAKSLPGPDERERLGGKKRERTDALKAEKAEIARRLSAAPLPERPSLVQRQTAIADALYREEGEDKLDWSCSLFY